MVWGFGIYWVFVVIIIIIILLVIKVFFEGMVFGFFVFCMVI